jgi:hypothetical protein
VSDNSLLERPPTIPISEVWHDIALGSGFNAEIARTNDTLNVEIAGFDIQVELSSDFERNVV